ncbi:cadherin-like beta sandwich domain-containing protein [Citricoccus sp.]|uniref:cadherin-like beta sandwich domain-containing protein n=1 Tax=Citricoccus sp. TaxID=1978372 RepID=UPI0028BDD3BF|nr:cadherin-like beta sandwich domain-containing protein [Citricoccus sp.]
MDQMCSCTHDSALPTVDELTRSRVSRRQFGVLAVAAAATVGITAASADPAAAHRGPQHLTRGEFISLISTHFDWVHSSMYIDPYKLPQPTFNDVKLGKTEHSYQIETALEEGVVSNAKRTFNPRKPITRQDAADMLAKAFHLPASDQNALSRFSDANAVDQPLRGSVNAMLAAGFMTGESRTRLSPRSPLSAKEARTIFDRLTRELVSPPQVMCKPGTTAPRRYIDITTPTDGATIHYTYTDDGSEPADPSTDSPTFDLRQNGVLQFVNPLSSTTDSKEYRLKAVAVKDGMSASAVREFSWNIVRPLQGEFRAQQVKRAGRSQPAIWKINNPSEYYQANVYYIEGSRRGIVFDAGEYGAEKADLKDFIDTIASRPYDLVLGHNHPDHAEQIHNFTSAGVTLYCTDREKAALSAARREDHRLAGQAAVAVEDGFEIDLGNVQVSLFHAPGHTNGLITALINQAGWVYCSDHYGCNRPYTADTTQFNSIRADLFLSLQRQLVADYRKRSRSGRVVEVTNAHQDVAVGMECIDNFIECFQNMIDDGDAAIEPSIRGGISGNPTGPVRNSRMSKVGDMWRDPNWIAVGNSIGAGLDQPRDYLSSPTDAYPSGVTVDYNAEGGHLRYSVLSHLEIDGGRLVGTDVHWAPPSNGVENRLTDKFNPWVFDYEIVVPRGTRSVSVLPTAMSSNVRSLTVNGSQVRHSRPVRVPVRHKTRFTVGVVAPDSRTSSEYTFTVRVD